VNKDIAKTRFSDLLFIAKSDGKVTKNEYHLLLDIAKIIGLSEDEALDMINGENHFQSAKPTSYHDRMQHLFQLLFIMKIDGDIDRKEIEAVKNIALYLGLNLNLTDDLIDVLRKHKNQLIPEKEMIEQVKKYLN